MNRLWLHHRAITCRAGLYRRAFSDTTVPGNIDFHDHLRKLKAMYRSAPISGIFNQHDLSYDAEGNTTINFTPDDRHCHTAMSLHGAGYFKLLDDAAFFAAQGRVTDGFAFTTSFTTYMMRPVSPGTQLTAHGNVTSVSKALVVAESTIIETGTGKLVAQGSGTFQKGPFPLNTLDVYHKA